MISQLVSNAGYWILLIVAGLACGFLNTLASSGSAVSLPILVMFGLSPGAANATNRLPVLIGSMTALWTFQRRKQVDWRAAARLAPAAGLGSIVGVLLAEALPNRQMGIVITAAILIALLLLFTKVKQALGRDPEGPPRVTIGSIALMFVVGAWLGFIVLDGATYLMLVLILVCHYGLARANALKVLLASIATLVAIAMFSHAGDTRWLEGGLLSAGSVVGGDLGARLSSHSLAKLWAFRALETVIVLELVHLGWHYFHPLIELG
jgi:uncharacterized membrane protein YfcA